MAFRLKKLSNNKVATSSGVMLLIIPYIITIILTGVFVPMDIDSDGNAGITVGGYFLDIPINYHNMTRAERVKYLNDTHGGNYTHDRSKTVDWQWYHWIPVVGQLAWLGQSGLYSEYRFPDGVVMTNEDFNNFVHGDAQEPDYVKITSSIITLDPPGLENIGIYGSLVRVILIVSVAIGLVDILWFG